MERILTKDVGGFRAGQILAIKDETAFRHSLAEHHGVRGELDSYSLPVEEAARRYVAGLTGAKQPPPKTGRQP